MKPDIHNSSKPEGRRPKAERNPKPEGRNGNSRMVCTRTEVVSDSDFGFRPSFGGPPPGVRVSGFGFRASPAFTLIELLIVIAIISILAGMIIPIAGAVNRSKIRKKASGELEQVATAIELYKAKLGHYPPDNPRNPGLNQLYFELLGTTFTNGTYTTLDGSAQAKVGTLALVFGGAANVGGIINSSQGTGGEEGRTASSFLTGLKPGQVATNTVGGPQVKFLACSIPVPNLPFNPVYYVS